MLKGLALYEVRLVLRSKRRITARVSTPASNKTALLNKRTFISKLFTLIEDSIYKRRSTGDTQVALTDTIYEKVRRIYICVRYGSCGGLSTVRVQYCGGWFRFDKGIMPGRRSSTVGSRRVRFGSRARTRNRRGARCTILAVMYVNLDLRDSSNGIHTQRRTTSSGLDETENISIKKLLGLYDQRDQSARERGYSSSGEAKSSPLLIEPSVRGSSSTCYEAPVFDGSPLLDLERRTSRKGKAHCAWLVQMALIFHDIAIRMGDPTYAHN
ncbi:hypothetical protein TSUD_411680 [Trifolium subterraneum]|uniref:Uncharacterized protein n=1 Tax=Trifolium subterraneum TaxID=3900 RepID=A0A2Z6PV29_TRISU|nr:hypothetical protein TSUD_411680 [Trifolium subterraneum]